MRKEEAKLNDSRDAENLQAAFGQEGCPVCTVVLEAIKRAMDNWQYEGFTDAENRQEVVASRGFCPLHTWQLAQLNISFQLGVVYRDVIADMLASLDHDQNTIAGTNTSWERSALAQWWKKRRHKTTTTNVEAAHAQCPFCPIRENVEGRLIPTLLELLRSDEMQALLKQSTGLCLQHFAQACTMAEERDPLLLRSLVQCQQTCLQEVLGEVQEFVRKHDYRFKDEPRGNEMTSWKRAIELCAGNLGVF